MRCWVVGEVVLDRAQVVEHSHVDMVMGTCGHMDWVGEVPGKDEKLMGMVGTEVLRLEAEEPDRSERSGN